MKNNRLLPVLAAALCVWNAARAEEPRMVEMDVCFVKATKKQTDEWLPFSPLKLPNAPKLAKDGLLSIRGIFTAEEMAKRLPALKKSGAQMVSVPRILTVSGREAKARNAREIRYPAEYSSGEKGGKVIPLSFDTKNVGLEARLRPEVMPDGEGAIDLALTVGFTELEKFVDYSEGGPNKIWQPVFHIREVSTSVFLYSGQTVVIEEWVSGEGARALILITAKEAPES